MELEKHIRIAGVLHIVSGSMHLLAGLVVIVCAKTMGFTIEVVPLPSMAVSGIGPLAALLVLFITTAWILGGIGLLRHRPWARGVVLIVSFLSLFSVPLGTLLGIYSFWVLLQDKTRCLLEEGPSYSHS